jgi:hypothetical protein
MKKAMLTLCLFLKQTGDNEKIIIRIVDVYPRKSLISKGG